MVTHQISELIGTPVDRDAIEAADSDGDGGTQRIDRGICRARPREPANLEAVEAAEYASVDPAAQEKMLVKLKATTRVAKGKGKTSGERALWDEPCAKGASPVGPKGKSKGKSKAAKAKAAKAKAAKAKASNWNAEPLPSSGDESNEGDEGGEEEHQQQPDLEVDAEPKAAKAKAAKAKAKASNRKPELLQIGHRHTSGPCGPEEGHQRKKIQVAAYASAADALTADAPAAGHQRKKQKVAAYASAADALTADAPAATGAANLYALYKFQLGKLPDEALPHRELKLRGDHSYQVFATNGAQIEVNLKKNLFFITKKFTEECGDAPVMRIDQKERKGLGFSWGSFQTYAQAGVYPLARSDLWPNFCIRIRVCTMYIYV